MVSNLRGAKEDDNSDVSADINSVLNAEKRAEQLIIASKKEVDDIMRHWNNDMIEERSKLDSKLNTYKTESIDKGMKEIDTDVKRYIADIKKESMKITKREVDDKFLKSLADILFKV